MCRVLSQQTGLVQSISYLDRQRRLSGVKCKLRFVGDHGPNKEHLAFQHLADRLAGLRSSLISAFLPLRVGQVYTINPSSRA